MNISGEYGTELLLRYTDERLLRELEDRRVANERAADDRREKGTRLSRFARFFFREEVAAGGPEWVRPGINAEAVIDSVARPDNEPTGEAAGSRVDEAAAVSEVPTEFNDERMPSRTLVDSRR